MNYFTKEELEDITNSLLDNPSRDTLKELYIKYNGQLEETPNNMQEQEIGLDMEMSNSGQIVNEKLPVENEVQSFPEFKIHNPETINNGGLPNAYSNQGLQMPEQTQVINQNSNPSNINNNIFESQNRLMQTTDNFNPQVNPNMQMPNVNTTFSSNPFFGGPSTQINNQPQPANIQSGPSMFGQIMQNNS